MAADKRGRKGQPPQRRHLRSVPTGPEPPEGGDSAEDQLLFQSLRSALRSDGPLELLAYVSAVLDTVDPRSDNPFEVGRAASSEVGLDALVESFIARSYAETTAALTALTALHTDEVMGARIGRELTARRQPMPLWLRRLDQAQVVSEVWLLSHVLGDGDDYIFAVDVGSGHQLTAVIYVDHDMGAVIKDAFVVPAPAQEVLDRMREIAEEGQSLEPYDPAAARAIVEHAIRDGAMVYPPLESESWPQVRRLVEWMVEMLPAGGDVPERAEWSDAIEDRASAGIAVPPCGTCKITADC